MSSSPLRMTDQLLNEVVSVIAEKTGNIVGPKQMHMIESRLTKRLLDLGLRNENEYLEYFRENREKEFDSLISLLTVHHTYFFREFSHFEFLGTEALYRVVESAKKEGRKKIYIWSAACSRGQEVYSLGMYIHHYLRQHNPEMSFEILGSDIDKESVAHSSNGVYAWDEIKEIPIHFLSEYWTRGTGDIAAFAKVKKTLRQHCDFKPVNLMELQAFKPPQKFDIIFCRNVFIYFKAEDIKRIVKDFNQLLSRDGYLFVGLSESLGKMDGELQRVGPSVYNKSVAKMAGAPPVKTVAAVPVRQTQPSPIKVLCVDDSPTILNLLRKILVKESGFEVIGTAMNGKEAAEKMKTGPRPDVVTLDIHMPEMTGVEYLEKYMTPDHPAVVMLTSASRDNMDLAYKALSLGAKDYIEKPSLNNLATQADEIRSKLRYAHGMVKAKAPTPSLELEKKFQTSFVMKALDDKVRVIYLDPNQAETAVQILKTYGPNEPATVVVVNGDEAQVQKTSGVINQKIRFKTETSLAEANKGKIVCLSEENFLKGYFQIMKFKQMSYLILKDTKPETWQRFPKSLQMQILLNENLKTDVFARNLHTLTVCPPVSFHYMSNEFFAKLDKKAAA